MQEKKMCSIEIGILSNKCIDKSADALRGKPKYSIKIRRVKDGGQSGITIETASCFIAQQLIGQQLLGKEERLNGTRTHRNDDDIIFIRAMHNKNNQIILTPSSPWRDQHLFKTESKHQNKGLRIGNTFTDLQSQ